METLDKNVSKLIGGRNKLNFMCTREKALQDVIIQLNVFRASMKYRVRSNVSDAEVITK